MGLFDKLALNRPADAAATIGEQYTVIDASDFNHHAQYLNSSPKVENGDVLKCEKKNDGYFEFQIVSRVVGDIPENPTIPTSHATGRKHHPSTYGLQHLKA